MEELNNLTEHCTYIDINTDYNNWDEFFIPVIWFSKKETGDFALLDLDKTVAKCKEYFPQRAKAIYAKAEKKIADVEKYIKDYQEERELYKEWQKLKEEDPEYSVSLTQYLRDHNIKEEKINFFVHRISVWKKKTERIEILSRTESLYNEWKGSEKELIIKEASNLREKIELRINTEKRKQTEDLRNLCKQHFESILNEQAYKYIRWAYNRINEDMDNIMTPKDLDNLGISKKEFACKMLRKVLNKIQFD